VLSLEGTKLKFVTGPRLAHDHGENRAQKEDLMAEPENRPPPSRPDPNAATPEFFIRCPNSAQGGHHLEASGTYYWRKSGGKSVCKREC
jgi:hypothetical protein